METTSFEVSREDHGVTRVVTTELPAPAPGQVLLAVESVALTANNVTYAVTGDSLDYWSFYPAEDGWGRIPAMGWAQVAATSAEGVEVGTRTYGWYPLASHVLLDAEPTSGGFVDVGSHRSEHAAIYRAHTATDRDPLHRPGTEDRDALLRGLFLTAFLADDALAEQHPGLDTTVVTSASSKTAIGVAWQRRGREGRLVGLTSARNVAMVEGLDLYDDVLSYEQAGEVAADGSAAIVDIAGDRGTLATLHTALGGRLVHSMAIGRSHWDADRDVAVPDPRPSFFFAPAQAARRTEQWGRAGLGSRIAEALHGFVDGSHVWLDVEHSSGPEELGATYAAVREGRADPGTGHVVTLAPDLA